MKLTLILPDIEEPTELTWKYSVFTKVFLATVNAFKEHKDIDKVSRGFELPPLNLMTIASLTPSDIFTTVIDERIQRINFDDPTDLVGISVTTQVASKAYRMADMYRKRGVKVVLGGVDPTLLPEEAKSHADAIVLGDAEPVWRQLIIDFKEGRMKQVYDGGNTHNLEELPLARRDVINKGFYLTQNVIQVGRGCPHNCEFCSVTRVSGEKYRFRPVNDVVREIQSLSGKFIIFLDDNLIGNRHYAKELFRALIPLKINWFGDATISIGKDEEILNLAKLSGCKLLLIGFESLNDQTLKAIGKKVNRVEDYKNSIEKIHKTGISLIGSFIVGWDQDDLTVFHNMVNFINETQIEIPNINVLVPFPGTPIFERMKREGRLIHENWDLYSTTAGNVVFQPSLMTTKELREGYLHVQEEIFSLPSILKRLSRRMDPMIFTICAQANFRKNQSIRKKIKENYILSHRSRSYIDMVDN